MVEQMVFFPRCLIVSWQFYRIFDAATWKTTHHIQLHYAPLLHRWNPMAHIPMSWLVLVPIFCTTPKCFSCWLNLPHSIPEFPHKYIHIYIYHHEDVKLMACILGPGWTNQVDMNLPNLLVPGQRSPCRWGFLSVLSSGILQKPPDPGHSRTKPGFSFGPLGICYVHKILKEGGTKIWSNSWDTHLKLLLPR